MFNIDTIVSDLLASGESAESIAERFSNALNKASAANKRKEEVECWREEALDAIYAVCEEEAPFTYEIAGKAAALATLNEYPDLTLEDARELATANAEAIKASAKLYYKFKYVDKEKLDNLFNTISDVIAGAGSKSDRGSLKSDEDSIKKFLASLG